MTDERDGAREGRFWLIVHEPGNVPDRKGSWPLVELPKVMREFIAARPNAYLTVLTVGVDGTPNVQHGPEALQMADGRSMAVGSKHNARTKLAHSAALAASRPTDAGADEWTFTPDDREKTAILDLCAEQELSPTAVMRQALRLYQADHLRRKDGETVIWSGDEQRARDFAGPLATPKPPVDEAEVARIVGWIDEAIERAKKHGNTEDIWLFASQWNTVRSILARNLTGDGSGA